MVPSVHGPMTGAATGAMTAPAVTALLANSVVATIATFAMLIFILILQSPLIAEFAPPERRRVLPLISIKTRVLSPVFARFA